MRIRSLVWLLLLLLCCCKKHNNPVTPDPNFNFEYTATYDSVISMPANSSFPFVFYINVVNGDINNNKLSCTITNLPGNVTVIPASQVVGLLMGGVFTFNTGDIPVGCDTVILTISSAATGSTPHRLILNITPPIDYATKLAGIYDSSYDFCNPIVFKHASVVATVPNTPYTVNISNLNNLGSTFAVSAQVTNIITIPFQTVNGIKVWGSGTYNRDPLTGNLQFEIAINDTIVTGIDTQVCTAHIQHL